MAETPKDVLEMIKEHDVKIVDFRFMDFPGLWQHFSMPVEAFEEDMFEEGLGFDGSSIRGWQAINESDMIMLPDPKTAFIDPFFEHSTLVLMCDIADPITRGRYTRDPRTVARKAENYLTISKLLVLAVFVAYGLKAVFDAPGYLPASGLLHKPEQFFVGEVGGAQA